MTDYYCTTIIEFEDRFEGQILHVGTRDDCETVRDAIPAVAVKGDDQALRADAVVAETKGDEALTAGTLWIHRKPA